MGSHNRYPLMSSLFSGHYVSKRHPCFCIVLDGSFYLYLMFHGVKILQLTCFSGNKYLDYFLFVGVTLFWTNLDLSVSSPKPILSCWVYILMWNCTFSASADKVKLFAQVVACFYTLTWCLQQLLWLCILGNTFSGLLSFWFQYALLCNMRAPTLTVLLTIWDPHSRCDYPDTFSTFTFIGCLGVLNLWINLRRQDTTIKNISILHNTVFKYSNTW